MKKKTFKEIFEWAEKRPEYHKEGEAVEIAEQAIANERLRCENIVTECHKLAKGREAKQLLRRAYLIMEGYVPVSYNAAPGGEVPQ